MAEEKAQAEEQLAQVQRELAGLSSSSFSWAEVARHALRVQEVMIEKDPVALKRAYFELFKSITIGAEDENGVRPMTFTLKNEKDEPFEDRVRLNREMVEVFFRL